MKKLLCTLLVVATVVCFMPVMAFAADTTPNPTLDTTGDTTPNPTLDTTGDTTPNPTLDTTGDTTPNPTPDTTGDTTPNPTPDTTVDSTPDGTPDGTPNGTPNGTPDGTPNGTPNETPNPGTPNYPSYPSYPSSPSNPSNPGYTAPSQSLTQQEKAEIKAAVSEFKLTARSSRTKKGNVKVAVSLSKDTREKISELEKKGLTVKYEFYRSTKKNSGFKSMMKKTSRTYTNTYGEDGQMYYYRVKVRVYDQDGKLIASTKLSQCRYANRVWKDAK